MLKMDSSAYIFLILDNLNKYLLSIFITLIIYVLLFRKSYVSILDPFMMSIIFSGIGFSTVLFLYITDSISSYYLFSYLITQCAFFAGLFSFKSIRVNNIKVLDYKDSAFQIRFCKWLFIFTAIISCLGNLSIYYFKGIPGLAESRLNIIQDDGLFKVIKRATDIAFPCWVFLTIYFFTYKDSKPFKRFAKFSVLMILMICVLSGSKGAFVSLGSTLLVYSLFLIKSDRRILFEKAKKFTLPFLIFSAIIAITVILITETTTNPFIFFIYRVAIGGDVYYMTYPNAVIETLPTQNGLVALFASPLRMLGLIPADQVPEPLGFAIMKYHTAADLFKGPNPRHNVFGYVYLGQVGAIFYSFIIGLVLGFVRNKLFKILNPSIISCIIYYLLLSSAVQLETDFHNSLAALINIIVIMTPLSLISYSLSIKNNASKQLSTTTGFHNIGNL